MPPEKRATFAEHQSNANHLLYNDMVISEKIRTLRKEAGMSQEELADSIPALEYSKDEKN